MQVKIIRPDLNLGNLRKLLSVKLLIPVIIVVAIAGIAAGVYFFSQYQKAQKQLAKTPQLGALESQQIVNKIAKLIELPADEQPSVATVSDVTKLKDQPFFAKAQNGDKVLIYTEAKKAILYRPGTNKIVEVSTVNIGSSNGAKSTASATASPTSEVKLKVVLYNGTTTVGLTKTTQDSLTAKFDNIEIVARENASKSDYTKTFVIDLSGKNKATADQLAQELRGEVGGLPSSETKPNADILVILGENQ